jgi:hypothetical protein
VLAGVDWLTGPGRCHRVLIYPDDWVEAADDMIGAEP